MPWIYGDVAQKAWPTAKITLDVRSRTSRVLAVALGLVQELTRLNHAGRKHQFTRDVRLPYSAGIISGMKSLTSESEDNPVPKMPHWWIHWPRQYRIADVLLNAVQSARVLC